MTGVDLAAVITAGVALLGALGGGIKFLWDKIEKRFTLIEEELEKCRQRESKAKDMGAVHITVIELLWAELARHDPMSSVLNRAKNLLDRLKVKNEEEL